MTTSRISDLRAQAAQLQAEQPKLRQRDLAQHLGLSEAEYLTLYLGEHVTRLNDDFKSLLLKMHQVGPIMALTRNEHAVHERKGVYENVTFYEGGHNMGVAVNPDIDLRFFMNQWHYGLAVEQMRGNRVMHSFQFFDAHGTAVHKIFTTPKSDEAAYLTLREAYRADTQSPLLDLPEPEAKTHTERPDADIDVAAFRTAWKGLQDTHDFFAMLRKHNVTRTQGLRLAPEGFTQRVAPDSVVRLLELAAERQVAIMCFLHSAGMVQIHTGTVKNLMFYGDWYNVMDPKFNLHLYLPAVASAWVVKKPTADGIVTSLELFDENGELITYFFGARKPGVPELESWREIVAEVAATTLA